MNVTLTSFCCLEICSHYFNSVNLAADDFLTSFLNLDYVLSFLFRYRLIIFPFLLSKVTE